MEIVNDLALSTAMIVFGAVIALVLAAVTSTVILGEGWPKIRREVVEANSTGYGMLTGSIFVAVCALVGVANRQSISPVWDPSWADRLSFLLFWVIYGLIVSFVLSYAINFVLFGLTPVRVREELRHEGNASIAAITGMTYLGVSMLVVFRIF